jgi:hypothetical protein
LGIAVLVTVSCAAPPIDWDDPAPLPPDLATAPRLAFDAQRRLVGRPAPLVSPPVFTGQCTASARVAQDSSSGDWYAVWWGARMDSTADVLVSRSSDAVTWSPALRVDSTDAGRVGCERPAPAIAADRGNVFIVYAMTAREGPGIFASHSMDRGMMFHSPVAVVYGERIGLAAVAARGDMVAVVYEDPNTLPRRISLALSRTMGHLFQHRMTVSPNTGQPARSPGVALGDGKVAVTWTRGASTDASAPRVVRLGEVR